MATDKQIAANRLNAVKSTRPRTPQSKRRSSEQAPLLKNAWRCSSASPVPTNCPKYGLSAETLIIPGEDTDDYEELHEAGNVAAPLMIGVT